MSSSRLIPSRLVAVREEVERHAGLVLVIAEVTNWTAPEVREFLAGEFDPTEDEWQKLELALGIRTARRRVSA